MSLVEKIEEAKEALLPHLLPHTKVTILLGTGLAGLGEKIRDKRTVNYGAIPHFPTPSGAGHRAEVYLGILGGKPVVAFGGRFHLYEGHNLESIVFPVRVAKALGAEVLLISNAAGGLNPNFRVADIMLIEDQLNFTGLSPLVGPNDERLGPRFPDMSAPYDPDLLALAEEAALEIPLKTHRGTYTGVLGPQLETRAEYRAFRLLGADAVGMSTVHEVIVGVHAGLRILGLSVITDLCLPDALEPVNIEKILENAAKGEAKLTKLVEKFLEKLP